jgi:hypothetical protein
MLCVLIPLCTMVYAGRARRPRCESGSAGWWGAWLCCCAVLYCYISILNTAIHRYCYTSIHLYIYTAIHLYYYTTIHPYLILLYIYTAIHLYYYTTTLLLYIYRCWASWLPSREPPPSTPSARASLCSGMYMYICICICICNMYLPTLSMLYYMLLYLTHSLLIHWLPSAIHIAWATWSRCGRCSDAWGWAATPSDKLIYEHMQL